jgi:U3 small nucleolar RNA-associated protein 20
VPMRAAAAAALLQFLLDYPLGSGRLRGHVQFLLSNTAYEHESGRLQALEMLQQILVKFPPEVTAKLADVVYLPLVARLANETAPKARAQVCAAAKLLHQQLDTQANDTLAGYCRRWLGDAGGAARRAAVQALGLLAEAEGAKFRRRLDGGGDADGWLLRDVSRLLQECAAAAELSAAADAFGDDEDAAASVPRWREAYHLLLLLEKAVAAAGLEPLGWDQGADARRVWGAVARALLHPHLWVRKASGRLVGSALAAPAVRDGLLANGGADADGGAGGGAWQGTTPGELALSIYMQLESDVVDDALCGQAVKCLVSLAGALAAEQPEEAEGGVEEQQEEESDGGSGSEDEETGEEDQEMDEAAEGAEGEKEGGEQSSEEEAEEEEEEAEEEGEEEEPASAAAANGAGQPPRKRRRADGAPRGPRAVTLRGLVLRMVKLAEDKRVGRRAQRLAALRWLAAAATAVGTAPLARHLPLMLRPLYRISEAASAGGRAASAAAPEVVRTMGEEVLAHLRDAFGADAMLAAYNAARELVRTARASRKKATAMRALMDPEAAARQKLKRNAKKAAGRKRKMEEKKRRRTAKGSGGFGSERAKGAGGRGAKRAGGGGGRGDGGGRGGRGSKRPRS